MCFTGDLFERWTNGVFKSTLHRVVNATPGKERYSCAYFVAPNYDAEVRNPTDPSAHLIPLYTNPIGPYTALRMTRTAYQPVILIFSPRKETSKAPFEGCCSGAEELVRFHSRRGIS